jgi:hypothetical protein
MQQEQPSSSGGGGVECKNNHFLNVARALKFTAMDCTTAVVYDTCAVLVWVAALVFLVWGICEAKKQQQYRNINNNNNYNSNNSNSSHHHHHQNDHQLNSSLFRMLMIFTVMVAAGFGGFFAAIGVLCVLAVKATLPDDNGKE